MTEMNITTGDLLMTPALPLLMPHATGWLSHAAMLADFRAWAEAVPVTEKQLADWAEIQVEWLWNEYHRVAAAVISNEKLLTTAEDPRWGRYWQQEAKARYLYKSLQLVNKVRHVLVCVNHGLPGVGPEELAPAHFEGLAFRGLITDGKTFSWDRLCVDCAKDGPIKVEGGRLYREWMAAPSGRARGCGKAFSQYEEVLQ